MKTLFACHAVAVLLLTVGQVSAESIESHNNPLANNTISVAWEDTDRSDWEGIPWYEEDFEDELFPVDINQVRIAHDAENVYFQITSHQWEVDELWRVGLYIDTDIDPETGYNGDFLAVGADVFIENDVVSSFIGDSSTVWAWEEAASGLAYDHSNPLDKEIAVPRAVLGETSEFDFMLFANNFCCDFGEVDDAYPDAAAVLGGDFYSYELGDVPVSELPGDFDSSGAYELADIDLLTAQITAGDNNTDFDLNSDSQVNASDLATWLKDYGKTWVGDSNLDGEFNSADLVEIFRAGQYEDGIAQNSSWSSGDWNGDSEFDTNDLVVAFQDGGFENGPRAAVAVPEPTTGFLLFSLLALLPLARNGRASTE